MPNSIPLQRPRALVIGEALIDTVRRTDGTSHTVPGGSPANVALGLARLDRPTDLLTWLGDDPYGDLIRRHLTRSSVHILRTSTSAFGTPVATAILDDDGAPHYEFDLTWDVAPSWELDQDPLVVHTGSLATFVRPGAAKVLELVAEFRQTATITYDPNLRPALLGSPDKARPLIEQFVELSDVVKMSREDLDWLFPGGEVERIAQRWLASGPEVVVVTAGLEGADTYTRSGLRVHTPARRVPVVDTVGAGDAFMSGLIDALWSAGLLGAERRDALARVEKQVLESALNRGTRIAALTVAREGGNPPRLAELSAAEFEQISADRDRG